MRLRSTVPAVLSAAALLVLPACSGDSEDTAASSSSSSSSAAETSATAGQVGDFCAGAQSAVISFEASVQTVATDPSQFSAALQASADQLAAITPPEEIAADWQTLTAGVQQLADGTAGIDVSTEEGAAQLDTLVAAIGQETEQSSTNVEAYLTSTCGITEGSPTT